MESVAVVPAIWGWGGGGGGLKGCGINIQCCQFNLKQTQRLGHLICPSFHRRSQTTGVKGGTLCLLVAWQISVETETALRA